MTPLSPIDTCVCCGSKELTFRKILWDELSRAWGLAEYEIEYVDRQQGLACKACGSNLRSMALALAICSCYNYSGTLMRFVEEKGNRQLRVLEINEAGGLTKVLSRLPGHRISRYPQLDMMRMPYPENSFDLVVHSDTLEHVSQPIAGLSECHRVLAPGGYCSFTVPMIVDRLTSSRAGLPPSYHGTAEQRDSDLIVQTEYGCDAWKHLLLAGFRECRLIALEYPSALALTGRRWN